MPTHFQGRKETVRALNAFVNLMRASDSVAAHMTAQIEQSGLTMGQFGVMEALLHLGPMCQHTLAEKLLRSGGNITLVIDNLEKHGWVRRERQKDDRRLVKIYLTPEGRTADRARISRACRSRRAGNEPVDSGGTRDSAPHLPEAGQERRRSALQGKKQEGETK